ncbi:MAG: RNA polymerase sigma factor [Acidimicrobiales bacterium]
MPRSRVAEVFADEWPVLVATLRRDLGDLGLAEEVAQDAFVEAAARWGPDSTPDRPGAWLLTTARRRAIDQIRRDKRFAERLPALADLASAPSRPESELIDDQLALIFGCCHDSLNAEAQIALTLREVCGLSTNQIADTFLVATPTMAKRLVRAKDKIRKAKVPFVVPEPEDLPSRLAAVLHVIYLIFTAGHTNSEGPALVRGDLCDEARWLCEILDRLLASRPPIQRGPAGGVDEVGHEDHETVAAGRAEVQGLLALMMFTDARRATRIDDGGRLVLLEEQDRGLWDQKLVANAQATLATALAAHHPGPYQLQAIIAGLHTTAPSWEATDWSAIGDLYGRLSVMTPSPVVSLNHAVARSMAEGPAVGLAALDELGERHELDDYRYFHAARADLLRRLESTDEAIAAYRRAIELGGNEAEQEFLRGRLRELGVTDP